MSCTGKQIGFQGFGFCARFMIAAPNCLISSRTYSHITPLGVWPLLRHRASELREPMRLYAGHTEDGRTMIAARFARETDHHWRDGCQPRPLTAYPVQVG